MSKIDHPSHYGGKNNPYETIKVLQAWLTPQEYSGFLKGNALKYMSRHRDKGGQDDLDKALWYHNELSRFVNDVGYCIIYPNKVLTLTVEDLA